MAFIPLWQFPCFCSLSLGHSFSAVNAACRKATTRHGNVQEIQSLFEEEEKEEKYYVGDEGGIEIKNWPMKYNYYNYR